jgi:hypothetical protein
MQEGHIDVRRIGRLAAASVVVALSAPAVGAAPKGGRAAVERTPARALVAVASDRAAAKLRRPECRELLSDFTDEAGRPLSRVLEERGLGVSDFLSKLIFLDGRNVPRCAGGNVAAGASPGSPYIAVCKETFARVQADDPGLAANVVIHEMLHALGLGEDPPTSEEITRQVARRCGR